jgi:hypothetical protein
MGQVREGVWMCGVARVKWCAAVAPGRTAVEYGSLEERTEARDRPDGKRDRRVVP